MNSVKFMVQISNTVLSFKHDLDEFWLKT